LFPKLTSVQKSSCAKIVRASQHFSSRIIQAYLMLQFL
jgi:hypothetical protein